MGILRGILIRLVIMEYERFKAFILRGRQLAFAKLCLKRAQDIESAYGCTIDELVRDDDTMRQALVDLEWKISKVDLDNYQNTLRHYYEMVHGCRFSGRVSGNRRLEI